MALEDIERLKEKISKDPNSKLFVPLAEEYKKAGMLDEAIEVLVSGLEKQPGYLSARVSLGKIFIERGLMHEAQSEFEKVIGAIPDNLYAHKKLAEIYRDLGEREKAIREFKTVLKLNPMDEVAAASLSEIEQGVPSLHEEQPVQAEAPILETTQLKTDEPPHGIAEFGASGTTDESSGRSGQEEKVLSGVTSAGENIAPENILSEDVAAQAVEAGETTSGIPVSDEDLDLWTSPSEGITEQEKRKEDIPGEISISDEDRAIWESHAELMKTGIAEGKEHESPPAEEIDLWKPLYDMEEEDHTTRGIEETPVPEDATISINDVSQQEEVSFEKISVQPENEDLPEQPAPSAEDADIYISEGKYFSAMNIYRKILSNEPDNKQILQRMEELKALLKLLGKDKEELVSKLDGFLDGIRKRRDELLGSS